jgi:hypothetical protein
MCGYVPPLQLNKSYQITKILSHKLDKKFVSKFFFLQCVSSIWQAKFDFKLKPIFATAQLPKNSMFDTKIVKNDYNHLTTLILLRETDCSMKNILQSSFESGDIGRHLLLNKHSVCLFLIPRKNEDGEIPILLCLKVLLHLNRIT